jgi:hypothetical protein
MSGPLDALSSGPMRLARAALVAAVVLGLALGAHAAGHGARPDPLVIGALGALILTVTSALAGRRFTVPVLVAVLGGGQLALHAALSTLGRFTLDPSACMPAAAPGVMTAMSGASHAAVGACLPLTAMPLTAMPMTAMPGAAMAPGAGPAAMVVAHLAATAVAVLLIGSGDRALWWLLAWLRPLRLVPARPAADVVVRGRVSSARARVTRRRTVYLRTSPRRGPPGPIVPSPA